MLGSVLERQAAAEVEAAADLYFFSRYMFKTRRGYRWRHNWHHQVICDALMKVYRGETRRLIINIPPRYSKTELAVVNFIAWCMGNAPDSEFIHCSYSKRLAENNVFNAKTLVMDPAFVRIFPGLQLLYGSNAKGDWRTTAGGVVYAQGAGGTITGFGAGKLRAEFGGGIILDDLHKPDEAMSPVIREGVIDWFKNTLESRLNDPARTPIILIMQRLHERDIAGWLIENGNGEEWDVLTLPAMNNDETATYWPEDQVGEALWPAMHTIPMLQKMEIAKPWEFAGQYMQRPAPKGGAMFMREWFTVVDEVPAGLVMLRDWDLAASVPKPGTDPDWTVGLQMGRCSKGFYYITDVRRFRGTAHEVERMIFNTSQQDTSACTVSLKQDPGQAGKAQVEALVRMLAGFTVRYKVETGEKAVRANPLASQVEAGNVKVLRAAWNKVFFDEIEFFPFGRHDDQVDAAASALNELARASGPQHWLQTMKDRTAANQTKGT